MKSLVIPFFQIWTILNIAAIWGGLGHQYICAMGHCPKVPQPSKLPHQALRVGTKHSECLLRFDTDLSRP